jgi:hypothetical protein
MVTKGYHTLEDRGNAEEIEEWGPRMCFRDNAWLGEGYYFWDGDIYWAHDWGKKVKRGYMIFEGEITIDENTYDLVGSVAHKLEFAAIMHEIESKLVKPGQTITVPKVIEYIKKYAGFPYNSIRAADYPGSRAQQISFGGKWKEFMYLYERVQICLINKNNLNLHSFKVIYPDNYVQ